VCVSAAHHLAVRRLRFCPAALSTSSSSSAAAAVAAKSVQLASCSQDHSVKIHQLSLDNLLAH